MRRLVLTTLPLVLLTAACGSGPTSSLPRVEGDRRLVAAYDRSGPRSWTVTVPEGTRRFVLRMDCVAGTDGEISLAIAAQGSGAVPCREGSSPGGAIIIDPERPTTADRQTTVEVTAPKGARWSVALDVR